MEILRSAGDGAPRLLDLSRFGLKDRVELWYACSMGRRPLKVKRLMRLVFKAVTAVTRTGFAPSLNLAIQKT